MASTNTHLDHKDQLVFNGKIQFSDLPWVGSRDSLFFENDEIRSMLLNFESPLWAVRYDGKTFLTSETGYETSKSEGTDKAERLAYAHAVPLSSLGDASFMKSYGTRYAYYSGAMANAISSVEMVIALGKAGLMGSYGSAGVHPDRVEQAIQAIQKALPNGPYVFNLINSPNEQGLERRLVELYLKYDITVVEASAYMVLTYGLVHYRAAGLSRTADGTIKIKNRIIAKISRKEVARQFMEPAQDDLLNQLVAEGKITEEQAELAKWVPMADDITVEADSGGHTDNRPLVGLIPTMLAIRDVVQRERQYPQVVRVGAGGGISTPASALAAFMMGAAYIVTGSINQACVEAGASAHTRKLLSEADMADIIMAPAADMFEMGVRVQVLKRGTMFAMRASRLYDLYNRYNSIEELPEKDRQKIEKTIFRRSLEEVWSETEAFFKARDPMNLERAYKDEHHKMALIFRWYLGLSSRWSVVGDPDREMDYQIWCGPSMGSFNEWVRGTYLEEINNRKVVDVILQILTGAAYLSRLRSLNMQGVRLLAELEMYYPGQPLI
jgi:PfaD family protein